MEKYQLSIFGEIDLENLADYYEGELEYDNRNISLDLNFESSSTDEELMEIIQKFIQNISKYDAKNRNYIEEDFYNKDGETIKEYCDFHINEIGKEKLKEVIVSDTSSKNFSEQIMKNLKLIRIGIYPENDDNFAVFDYTFNKDLTNYVIAISTDVQGQLDYMSMES